jgi:hypothetical protein
MKHIKVEEPVYRPVDRQAMAYSLLSEVYLKTHVSQVAQSV